MTVSEIAERLRPIAPDVEATITRLRHWTTQLMLLPVQQLHQGTGKHRLYAADDVYSAAILHVLTSFGLTVSAVRPLVDGLSKARFAAPKWKEKRGPLYLAVWRRAPGRAVVDVTEEEPKTSADLRAPGRNEPELIGELMLVIDLARLWSRIEGG